MLFGGRLVGAQDPLGSGEQLLRGERVVADTLRVDLIVVLVHRDVESADEPGVMHVELHLPEVAGLRRGDAGPDQILEALVVVGLALQDVPGLRRLGHAQHAAIKVPAQVAAEVPDRELPAGDRVDRLDEDAGRAQVVDEPILLEVAGLEHAS